MSDQDDKALCGGSGPDLLKKCDLILSCGDLDARYLEYLVTMARCPLLYVHGNHDSAFEAKPPEGCVCIEDKVYDYKGLRILGLGGSMRYKPDAPCMYTEEEMRSRILKCRPEITLKNGFDILLTHSPAKGYGDLRHVSHSGFECFNGLLDRYRPACMIHGHVHQSYTHRFERTLAHPSGTKIINACGKYVLEIGEDEYPAHGKTGSFLYDLYVSVKGK